MPPNRVPMLSTANRQITTTTVAATRATIEPGTRFANLRKQRITTTTVRGQQQRCG